jgi:Cys-Gly metallodipeptidase DUG1
VAWLNVLKYHYKKEFPVNLRYCFEGMEESGSIGLDDIIKKEAEDGGWFHGVDAVCIVSRLFVFIPPFR